MKFSDKRVQYFCLELKSACNFRLIWTDKPKETFPSFLKRAILNLDRNDLIVLSLYWRPYRKGQAFHFFKSFQYFSFVTLTFLRFEGTQRNFLGSHAIEVRLLDSLTSNVSRGRQRLLWQQFWNVQRRLNFMKGFEQFFIPFKYYTTTACKGCINNRAKERRSRVCPKSTSGEVILM